jgi:hypothetical protein
MSIRTFDPKEVSVIYGPLIIRGFSEDKISVVRDNPAWELVVGADGESTRVKSNDLSGTITLTLQQSSPSNDELSAQFNADQLSNAGLLPLYIKDNLGSTVISAATAYIEQIPEATYGKTQNDRVWTLRTDNLLVFLGGNPTPG